LFLNDQPVQDALTVNLDPQTIPASAGPRDNMATVTVPSDQYFVMGDNRDFSFDSRFWGFVEKEKIKGQAVKLYWSWDRKTSSVRWERVGQNIK
jgi:signal peptidase I